MKKDNSFLLAGGPSKQQEFSDLFRTSLAGIFILAKPLHSKSAKIFCCPFRSHNHPENNKKHGNPFGFPCCILEVPPRFELGNKGFADLRLTAWLWHRKKWSGRRGSDSRPQPWQGCALPTELLPHNNVWIGAGEETRTLTSLTPDPKSGASAIPPRPHDVQRQMGMTHWRFELQTP